MHKQDKQKSKGAINI